MLRRSLTRTLLILLLVQTGLLTVIALALRNSVDDAGMLWALPLLGLVTAGAVVFTLKRLLTSPAQQAAKTIQAFCAGDMNQGTRLDFGVIGELKPLTDAYNGLADKLQASLSMLVDSAQQFSSASREIAVHTESAIQHMERQRDETGNIGDTAISLDSVVSRITDAAREATDHVADADKLAQEGKEVMTEAIGAAMALTSDVAQASTVITDLGEKSADISKVLEVINSIAEQTNLLALNAAIEAARAGDAGRGFAVVADEVRSLAARTQESTANIRTTIQAVMNGVQQASDAISSGNEKAAACEELVENATIAFSEIVGAVSGFKKSNQQIADATASQSTAAETIQNFIEIVANITDSTDDDVRQIGNYCENMAKTARQLNPVVEQLRPASDVVKES